MTSLLAGLILAIAIVDAAIRRRITADLIIVLAFAAASRMRRHRRTKVSDSRAPLSAETPDRNGKEKPVRDCLRHKAASMREYEEAIFPRTYIDRDGNVLDGGGHYQVRGDMDMSCVWWSVTAYDESFSLIPNAEGRHSFTSFNAVPESDGHTFVIDVAPERPANSLNWLPSRHGETFNLVWRLYMPEGQILHDPEGVELPEIVCVEDRAGSMDSSGAA